MTQVAAIRPPSSIAIYRPSSLDELRQVVSSTPGPHYFLAGGTDLLVQHKDHLIPSSTWLDLTALGELRGIEASADEVRLGALVTHEEIRRSSLLARLAPALVQGCALIGGPQIRWRGTVGGNLANASPAADSVPALHTMGAQLDLLAPDGSVRVVAVEQLAVSPRRTLLADGELIIAVRFPRREGLRGTFVRLGQRQSQAISKVSVAASAVLEGEHFSYLRLACGSVAATVLRPERTEQVLLQRGCGAEAVAEAAQVLEQEVRPIDDLRSTAAYRRAMAGELLRRALAGLRG